MADTPDFQTEASPNMVMLIDYLLEGLVDPTRLGQIYKILSQSQIDSIVTAFGAQKKALETRDASQSSIIDKVEAGAEGAVAYALAHLVAHLLGVEVPPSALREGTGINNSSTVGQAIGKTFMAALQPDPGDLQPGDAGAVRLLSELSGFTLKSWFEGVLLEYGESLGGLIHPIEHAGELGRELIDAMGFGRLARVALRPLAQIGIATPLEWQLHKQYRPTLLTASTVARQWQRGRWDWADVVEELARAGYSDARIDALLNEQRKFLGISDVRLLEDHGAPAEGDSLKYLGAGGYDQVDAELFLRVEGVKQIDALNTTLADAIATAFADRKITALQRDDFYNALGLKATKLTLAQELADTRRALNIKPLSSTQVADCVKVGILGFTDYREALTREGYTDADGAALELLLRHTIDTKASLAALKQQQQEDRDAAKAAAAQKAAEKEAAAAARAALAKRGSLADNKAAAVRGLIPMSTYASVLAAHYDADTVTTLLELADAARQDYLATQSKRDAAAQRAADTGLNVGQIETAVLNGVLTLDQFQQGLQHRNLTPADVDVLVATLKQRVADRDAAVKQRAAALLKASTKSPTLATLEALVRAGHRSLADYDRYLVTLGYDDAGRAAIEELLKIKIAKDQAAPAARAKADATLKAKGLSATQMKDAVVLGVQSLTDYTTFLTQNHFTADAVSVLAAEAQDAADQAAVVRARRAAAKPVPGSPRLPLATVARAARLGLITLDAYRTRLLALGYTADDVELDVDELLVEIADTQAKRAAGGAAAATVSHDVASTLADAQILRAALDAGLKAKQLTTAELDAAVRAGQLSIDDYISEAEAVGLDPVDAELLGARLAATIATPATSATPASGKVSRAKKAAKGTGSVLS